MIAPGDVVCVRNPRGFPARMIRLGAALLDKPNGVNHVIVAHHVDAAGVLWGVEGRPGGVGWVDMRHALTAPYTVHNGDQPKTGEQRAAVVKVAAGMLGTPYDWEGIALDAAEAVHVQTLWSSKAWGVSPPAHVVCSSLADWAYNHVGLASPKANRTCSPGDWAKFIVERGWV